MIHRNREQRIPDSPQEGHLLARLHELEHRWKQVAFLRSGGYSLLVTIAVLLLGCILDYTLALSILQRRLLTLGCYLATCSFAWGFWLRPYFRPLTPEQIAWLLERVVPEFNEKLISAVELRDAKDDSISMALVQRVLADAEVDLHRVNPLTTFPFRRKDILLPAVVGLIFLIALCVPSLKLGRLVKRVTVPLAGDATVGRMELSLIKPLAGEWPEGDAVEFIVRCSDPTVRKVELSLEGHRIRRHLMDYSQQDGLFRYVLPQAQESFDYWVSSGKARSSTHTITVLKRPSIQAFELQYEFPAYTELVDAHTTTTSGDLRGHAGTQVTLTIRASMPLVEMRMDWNGDSQVVPLDVTGTEGCTQIQIETNTTYTLHLRGGNNMSNLGSLNYAVTVVPDQPPRVTLEQPASNLFLGNGETLPLVWHASDDFGIETQELQCRVNGQQRVLVLDPEINRYEWNTATFGLMQGDEVEFFVRVHDARAQQAETQHRTIWFTRGERLRKAGPFMITAQKLSSTLTSLTNRIEQIHMAQDKVLRGQDHSTGRAAADLDHNRTMLTQHRDRLDATLLAAEALAGTLVTYGFYPRSRTCSDLLQRTFTFNRQFVSRDLITPRKRKALSAIGEMQDLTWQMTKALLLKAREQVPYIEVSEATMMLSLNAPEEAHAQRVRERLAGRAAHIAEEVDSLLTMDFKIKPGKPRAGLTGRYYAAETTYVRGARQLQLKPQHERVDSTINLPNEAAFGVGPAPFSATWSGYIKAKTAGNHVFFVASAGASRLYIDSRLIVNNDGDHGPQERNGRTNLQPGIHTIHLLYVNQTQAPTLALHWQPPGKPRTPVPAAVLMTGHATGVDVSLRALETELGVRANDFRELDTLAKEMRKRLKSTEEGLEQLAQDLKRNEAPSDWDQVEAIAEDLARQADAPTEAEATSVDAAQVKDELRDAAEALSHIAEEENAAALADVAGALAQLERQHELEDVKEEVRAARANVEAALTAIDDKQERGEILEDADAQALTKAAERLAVLRERPLDDGALHEVRETKTTDAHLKKAADALSRASAAIQDKKPEVLASETENARHEMRQAVDAIAQQTAKTDAGRDLAAKKLETYHQNDSEKLPPLNESIVEAYQAVLELDATDRPAIGDAHRKLTALAEDMDELARELEDEAKREVASEAGDIDAARNKLAAAAALDAANDALVQPACETLASALEHELDKGLKGRKRKKAIEEHEEAFQQDIREARKALAQSSREVLDTQKLLSRSEAAERRELPSVELAALNEELDAVAERLLSPELVVTLDRLEGVRESREAVTELAGEAAQLEKRANTGQAHELANSVDVVINQLDDLNDTPGIPAPPPVDISDPVEQPLAPKTLDSLSDQIDDVEEALATAQAAASRANALRADVETHEMAAEQQLDAIAPDALSESDRKRLADVQDRFDPRTPGQKAQDLRAMATMPGIEPKHKKQLETIATELQSDDAQERKAATFEKNADNNAAQVAQRADAMQKAVAASDNARADAVLDTLDEMADNALIGEYEAAQKNLDAIKADLNLLARGEHAMPEDANIIAETTEDEAPSESAADAPSEPTIAGRLQEMMASAPLLRAAADDTLPLHAREGLIEAAKAELHRTPEQRAPEADWAKPLAALAQPLARGDFETARELMRDKAADAFEKAAAIDAATMKDVPLLPKFAVTAPAEERPPPLPMNQTAFDGAAMAEALHNEKALQQAERGNYAEAAKQMHEQAKALTEPEHKALAEAAAEHFEAAETAKGAKTEREIVEGLPEEAQKALDDIEALTAVADPLAAKELAEAADAIEQQDYAAAAELVAAASLAIDDSPAEALAVADALEALDDAVYGDMSEEAREAVASLKVASDEILEAARREDYGEAEKLAKAQGEAEAAKHLAEAVNAQEEALPAAAQEAIKDLEAALTHADPQQRDSMEAAVAAARHGDLEAAEQHAQAAATPHREEAESALALEEAAAYRKDDIKPLEDALVDARANKFGHAANDAARSAEGQEAASALRDAEEQMQTAMQEAISDSAAAEKPQAENALKTAAQQVKANNLAAANNTAKQAGDAGQETRDAIAKAEDLGKQAVETLEAALEQASTENEAADIANQTLDQAREALGQEAKSGKRRQALEQEAAQALQRAEKALTASKLDEAAEQVTQASELGQQLDDIPHTGPAGDAAAQQRATLTELLKTAQESQAQSATAAQDAADTAATAAQDAAATAATAAADQLKAAAEIAQAGDPQGAAAQAKAAGEAGQDATATAATAATAVADQLKTAAEMAQAGDLQGAAAKAKAAGEAGQAAADALEQATQARKDAQAAAHAATAGASAAAKEAAANAASAAQRKSVIEQAANQAQQGKGNLSQAALTARQAAKESYAALTAAKAFKEAREVLARQAQQQMPTASNPQPPTGEIPVAATKDVADAITNLEAAEADLAQGQAQAETTENLVQAADALGQASHGMAQQALGEMLAGFAAPAPDQAPSPDESEAAQDAKNAGGGGGGGRMDQQKDEVELPEGGGDLGDSWEGVDVTLGAEDAKRRKMQYNDYYRKASQRYLEAIANEASEEE